MKGVSRSFGEKITNQRMPAPSRNPSQCLPACLFSFLACLVGERARAVLVEGVEDLGDLRPLLVRQRRLRLQGRLYAYMHQTRTFVLGVWCEGRLEYRQDGCLPDLRTDRLTD